jgi:hypothetical protein
MFHSVLMQELMGITSYKLTDLIVRHQIPCAGVSFVTNATLTVHSLTIDSNLY